MRLSATGMEGETDPLEDMMELGIVRIIVHSHVEAQRCAGVG
jgi:hypothetical protein